MARLSSIATAFFLILALVFVVEVNVSISLSSSLSKKYYHLKKNKRQEKILKILNFLTF